MVWVLFPLGIYGGVLYTPRKGGVYMRSYLLKASDDDFDRWRAAAVRVGGEKASLAVWIRAALDAVAVNGTGSYDELGSPAAAGAFREGFRDGFAGLEPAPRKFKPDFKGRR